MADKNGIKFTKSEVSQTFNLAKLLEDYVSKDALIDVIDEVKDTFVRSVISEIEERTLSGVDIDGKKFKPYTKDYADLKGVSRSDVDLYKDGRMFDAIQELDADGFSVKIGIEDNEEAPIAYNHNVGDTLPRRQFFGITKEDAQRIAIEALRER